MRILIILRLQVHIRSCKFQKNYPGPFNNKKYRTAVKNSSAPQQDDFLRKGLLPNIIL